MKRWSVFIKTSTFLLPFMLPVAHAGSMTPSKPQLDCTVNPVAIGSNGYQLEVYVTNTGNTAIQSWTVTLNFREPARITSSWNAHVIEFTPGTVTAGNGPWNGKLLPWQTTSFGMQGNHDGSFAPPGCSTH
jgi:hypothetical protein